MNLTTIEARIAKLEAEIAKETAIINAAIAAHQIGLNYWQRRHSLECQLRAVYAIRDAVMEAHA